MADVASIHFEDCPTSSITLPSAPPGLQRFDSPEIRPVGPPSPVPVKRDRAAVQSRGLTQVLSLGRGARVVSPRSPIVGPERARPWKRTAEPFSKDFTEPVGSGLCFPDICSRDRRRTNPVGEENSLLLCEVFAATNPAQAELSEGAVRLRDCFPGTVPALANTHKKSMKPSSGSARDELHTHLVTDVKPLR